MDDDDDISIQLQYDDGAWEWSETNNQLEFQTKKKPTVKADITERTIEFADDINVYAQHIFQRRYQRAKEDDDVVTLQDIKDVVLFSAPKKYVSIMMVKILHLPVTDRLLRAVIFYCHYYRQVKAAITERSSDKKLRTQNTDRLEAKLAEDLNDLRFLIAKEYSVTMFEEHFKSNKNRNNFLGTGCVVSLHETLFRFMTQIVWIALGRKFRREIEIEINRLFKTDTFNFIENRDSYYANLGTAKQQVLFGSSVHRNQILKSRSPLINELLTRRDTPYHMSGLGIIKYPILPPRLKYFEQVLILPEKEFRLAGVHVGILGLSRAMFDTMLKEIKFKSQLDLRKVSLKRLSMMARSSTFSNLALKPVLGTIVLPEREPFDACGDEFISETHPSAMRRYVNATQKQKWIARVLRLRAQDGHSHDGK